MVAKLQPNQFIFVSGVIEYSSIGSLVTGKRLEELNQYRKYPLPEHTSLQLIDPKVITPNGKMSESDEYVKEHFYTTKKNDGYHYQGLSKMFGSGENYRLPWVAVMKPGTKVARQYVLKKGEELDSGQKAVMCLRTFQGQGNNGISLIGVIVSSADGKTPAIRNYGGGGTMRSALSEMGISLEGNVEPQEPTDIPPRQLSDSDLPEGMSLANDAQKPAPKTAKAPSKRPASLPNDAPAPDEGNPIFDTQVPDDDDFYGMNVADQPVDDTPDASQAQAFFDSDN